MTNEQSNTNKIIAQAVTEAARVAIQAMTPGRAERTQNVGPRVGMHIIKQPILIVKQKTNIINSKISD